MSEAKTEFYTVVYRVVGGKSRHDEWWRSVHSLFLGDGPISITTMAVGDLISKLEEFEEQADASELATPCRRWGRWLCREPIVEAALGWDCATCGVHSPPGLNKRTQVEGPRRRVTSLSSVFLLAED